MTYIKYREKYMLDSAMIAEAKKSVNYCDKSYIRHEHDDCIKLAFEWLDAQRTIKTVNTTTRDLKHIIERWAGRYISMSDVEVAAFLHPNLRGKYPYYNLSTRLVYPSEKRLLGIAEARSQYYFEGYKDRVYSTNE